MEAPAAVANATPARTPYFSTPRRPGSAGACHSIRNPVKQAITPER